MCSHHIDLAGPQQFVVPTLPSTKDEKVLWIFVETVFFQNWNQFIRDRHCTVFIILTLPAREANDAFMEIVKMHYF